MKGGGGAKFWLQIEFKCNLTAHVLQVKNEEHKLARLIETTGPPELEDAQKEVAKLQNELIVRTKLNKLQTSKVHVINVTALV